jgi:predicted nucleic acid-binding protein
VITESCFLLGESAKAVESLMMLISSGVVRIEFSLENEVIAVQNLLKKYYNVPMSLADACLVRMSELFDAPVFTFDTDFRIYRRSRRNVIPLIGIDN